MERVCGMNHAETELLYQALCWEEGHSRRTQHILKVYALAKLLGEREGLPETERETLQAAAILHDIAIRFCKERYDGDACQANQKREAPRLVRLFLSEAGYAPTFAPAVIELVVHHHEYDGPRSRLLQLLMEADLLVNCFETTPDGAELEKIRAIFRTATGKTLFDLAFPAQQGGFPAEKAGK